MLQFVNIPLLYAVGSVVVTTLKSLDYNVVMTFRFNNNNNNSRNGVHYTMDSTISYFGLPWRHYEVQS